MRKVHQHVWPPRKEVALRIRGDFFVSAFGAAVFARQNPFGFASHTRSLENRACGAYPAPTLPDAKMPRSTAYSFYLIGLFSLGPVKRFPHDGAN